MYTMFTMEYTENSDTRVTQSEGSKAWSVLFFIVAGIVVITGIIAGLRIAAQVDAHSREVLLTRVQTAAYLIPSEKILKLDAGYSDTEKTEYLELKNSMQKLRAINTDARFVYLMGSNGSKLFFYVDSEDPMSEDYSPPGQVYQDTSTLQFENYKNGISFTEGPYKDSWGTWVSAYAPLYDKDQQIVAILGMDVDAKGWIAELRFIRVVVILIGFLIGVLFLLAGLYLRRSSVLLDVFEDTNVRLRLEREKLKGTLSKAHVGGWTLIPKTDELSFDEEMYALTGIPSGTRLTRESLYNLISEEDRVSFKRLLEMTIDHREPEFSHTLTIQLPNGMKKKIKFSTTIHYTAGNEVTLITGTAQDMST